MRIRDKRWEAAIAAALAALFGAPAASVAAPSYPKMAPIQQYLSASVADEIALARSAAPPSVSKAAEVQAFGPHGYDVAVKGTNGWVCIVERAWASPLKDPEFWNPKIRAPLCLNPPAVRSVLPEYLMRTQWVLSGARREQVIERAKVGVASKSITEPATGAMCYMTSKRGYLSDQAGGPWHPHLMFFLPGTSAAQWGANRTDSPVFAFVDDIEPITTFLVPIRRWSDGTLQTIR